MKYRLSDSALNLLHSCERMFQLERLLIGGGSKEDTPDTIFGKAFGIGVAEYLISQDIDHALFKTYLAYSPLLESEKKSQTICLNALIAAQSKMDTLLNEWEVVSFNGKPAIEMSFRLNIDNLFYFVGYVDVVLKNKYSGLHVILDAKTTGLLLHDINPLYKNSGQCLGYSIVLDKIVGQDLADYGVLYLVGQLDKTKYVPNIHILEYQKTIQDRLNWFITLGMDVKHLHDMLELNNFPMRGQNCLRFNKPCRQFGTCHLHTFDEYKEIPEDTIEYDFVYQLDEVIEDHLRRLS